MCHNLLQDPKLYALLLLIDQERAGETRSAGCGCGGVLHSARYPRKPRGGPAGLGEPYQFRLSFCCAWCRRRCTPASLRYLGRRVYLATVVVLASAMRAGLNPRRAARLSASLSVPMRTLERWRRWWLDDFVHTPFWQAARARFMPPVSSELLPDSLLARFSGADLATRLVHSLHFVSPLSTVYEGR